MSSRQEKRVDTAEAAAKKAASELERNKEERELEHKVQQAREKAAATAAASGGTAPPAAEQQRPGVLGSILKAVQGSYGHSKETASTAAHEASARAQEASRKAGQTEAAAAEGVEHAKDAAARKTEEYKHWGAEKAREGREKVGEYKDTALEKAREGKEKVGEYKDVVEEKAREGKDKTVATMGDVKGSAVGAARKAMDYLTTQKEEEEVRLGDEREAAKEKKGVGEDIERHRIEEGMPGLKIGPKESKTEAEQLLEKAKDVAEQKAAAAPKGGILSTLKEKIVGSKETSATEHLAPREQGGGKIVEERNIKVVKEGDAGKAGVQEGGRSDPNRKM